MISYGSALQDSRENLDESIVSRQITMFHAQCSIEYHKHTLISWVDFYAISFLSDRRF